MNMKKYISAIAILLFTSFMMGQSPNPGKVVAKVKDSYRSYCQNNKIAIPHFHYLESSLGITNVQKLFPYISKPDKLTNKYGDTLVDISLIYELEVRATTPIDAACRQLNSTGWFEYAEQKNTHQLLHTPNDPNIGSQYYLTNIRAFSGWDVSKGDSSIVVGISDTGFDFTHNDLVGSVAYNYNDPIDGIDNDNDGYVDNYQGWDLVGNDNNPQIEYNHIHGILVSSRTNNGIGMASVGYNTKTLPMRVSDSRKIVIRGYESIVYGATHGCTIINCSWGSQITDGKFGEDIINFATYNCNVLVVAACGNANNSLPYWPATYRNALSVGGTDETDHRWNGNPNGSTYGWDVDICAPANFVYAASLGNTYVNDYGTSYASPITAACAAIVKSYFTQLTPFQVAQRLRVTADNIDTIGTNTNYAGKLGKGRVNLYRALTDLDCPAVRYKQPHFSNNAPNTGDTVEFYATFKNYLDTTENLKINISLAQGSGTMLDSLIEPAPIATLGSYTNQSEPYRFVVGNNLQNSELVFKITYTDTNYADFEYISLYVNQRYINVDTNLIATTLSGEGKIGFIDNYYYQGLGFNYKETNQMFYQGGLIIGKNTEQVSNNIYGDNTIDDDFTNVTNPVKVIPSAIADFEASTVFNDNGAGAMKMNLKVTHKLLAWDNPDCENFIVHSFTVKNTGTVAQSDLYFGMYNDWDIYLSSYNKVKYDANSKMFYCWCTLGGKYGGIAALTEQPFNKYAFDNNGSNLSLELVVPSTSTLVFTDLKKFTALTSNRDSAGYAGSGNDISTLMAYKQISLNPGDSITLEFALLAGETPQDLADATIAARAKMHPDSTQIEQHDANKDEVTLSPNPAKNQLFIKSNEQIKSIEIFSSTGLMVFAEFAVADKNRHTLNTTNLTSGLYIIRIKTAQGEVNKKIIIQK
jgi:serine protease